MQFSRRSSWSTCLCTRSSGISKYVFLPSSWGGSNHTMQESYKNPSAISGRAYTPFAHWKFREFNELPHLFERRLKESYPIANMYMGQFPNEKLAIAMKSVLAIYSQSVN